MKLKTRQVPGWWTLSLRAFVVILGLIAAAAVASAQESKPAEKATTSAIVPAESADPTTTKPEIDARIPDAIHALMPSIVTITRIEPSDGAATTKPVSHAGIVVDPRGYIVVPLLPSQSGLKQFVVRLANQKEFVGELVGSDETLKLGVLKIESPQPLVAVSLAKIREPQVGDKVLLVTSPASKERFSGRVTSTTVDFGNENSPKFLQTNIAFPMSEYGSLMVSELGEPIGIFMASRPGEPPVSMATPLKLAMKLIDATTNPESKADAERPVFTVGLEPATLLFKQVVELFGPRGMKVTAFEEGKTLKIAAANKEVIEDFTTLSKLVAQELRKQTEPGLKPSAEKSSAVSLEPATPLAKSLVELFGPRGAKVLDFEAGKRLKVEAPGDVLLELEKMLKLVANEAQKQADLKRTLGQAQPSANEDVRVTGTPNESQPELASERLFHVRRNQTQLGGQRDGRTLAWVAVDPASSDVDNLKPGDVVDLVLPGDESFVVLDSDQTYVPKFKSVIEHVLVEQLQRPGNRREMGSNNRYVGLRLGIQITPAEIARIQSEPTYGDLSNYSTITHVVRLKHSRAEHLADLLKRSFSNVEFDGDVERNALVLLWNPSSPIQGLMDVEAAIRKLDMPSTGLAMESTVSRGLPDTPAAKQLVEQLGAQESAAAAEAATIRQLQANGQAEQNRQPIAEHQRKLKNLLSTAFDLKLQLEELQVKELQSRLSRLERQIGQRKELREKIINRRAGELIDGDALKWNAASPASTKVPGLAMKDSASGAMSSSSTTAAATKADHLEIDLYAGSQVLPRLGKNPGYSKLVQSLNAMKGVTVNIREAGEGDVIVMAIVRDPSQRCQREARQTQKESELRNAINSALKAAGIKATRWDENAAVENAESTSADDAEAQNESSKTAPFVKFLEVPAVINFEVIEATQNEAEARAKANERAAKLLWERLGLKSSGMVFRDQIPAEYRGGLMIDEVDAQRAAFAAGIRKGDILVGLHTWETVSLDNVLFVLNHSETQRAAPGGNAPLKVFVLRGKDRVLTPFVENGHGAEATNVIAPGFDD